MSRNIHLYRAFEFQAAWNKAALPWLEQANRKAWRSPTTTAVLIPSMTCAQFLKSQILKAGINFIGIHLLTPGECWRILHERLGIKLNAASREDLHLLLSSAAQQFPEIPSARSLVRNSSALMRSLDQLSAAGRQPADIRITSLAPVLTKFEEYLDEAELTTAQVIDRQLIKEARKQGPVFSSLLVIGFDGSYWPLWNMLNAAVSASETATVCLFEPRLTAEITDQVWINSWEEAHGEAEILSDSDQSKGSFGSRPFAALTEAMEIGSRFAGDGVVLHIGNNTWQQAQAIVAQAMTYLAKHSCTRLGIIFPGPGALARETAKLFSDLKIPHNDSIGHNSASEASDLAWQAWVHLQTHPGVQQFLGFLRLCPETADLLGVPHDKIERQVRRAYDELMVDDLPVLAAYLGWPFKDKWPALPGQGSIMEFLALTRQAIVRLPSLGGTERLAAIEEKAASFSSSWKKPFSRDLYLRWLTDVTRNFRRAKDDLGRHPYSRVQLLSYDKAEWQTWSHLILAGLNRNNWPPEYRDPPFLGQELIDELNRKALKQGSQGEGQRVVGKDKGLMAGPAERSAQVRRQFYNIIESAREGVCLTASRTDENDPTRRWNPSDLVVRLHAAAFGTGLSDEIMDNLQALTSKWLKESAHAFRDKRDGVCERTGVEQTARAFRARRDGNGPFGPYEFVLESPPETPVIISCTAWEKAVRWPEIVWMKYFLGIEDESWSPEEIPWSKIIGLWVHKWLSSALGNRGRGAQVHSVFHPLPSPGSIQEGLNRAWKKTRTTADSAFSEAGRSLTDWWLSVHTQARAMAEQLTQRMSDILAQGWAKGATEWPLPPGSHAQLPGGRKLRLCGRIDLVLAKSSELPAEVPYPGKKADSPYWIIDYKTGTASDRKLTPASVANGQDLQILLYALALKSRGMKKVLLSLARPGKEIGAEVDANELLDDERVVRTLEILEKMQETGIFGMKGDPRTEFGFTHNYPLATLRIDPEILERKWERTFGSQSNENE